MRKRSRRSNAARKAPRAIPGTKPAAKDLPLKVVPEEAVLGLLGGGLLSAVGAAAVSVMVMDNVGNVADEVTLEEVVGVGSASVAFDCKLH